jgi:hypothetical protein
MYKTVLALSLTLAAAKYPFLADPLPGCEVYSNNQCAGDTIETDASFANNRWFTPAQGEEGWQPR